MTGRFLGEVRCGTLCYSTAQAPTELTDDEPLTVLACGFLTNLPNLQRWARRRATPPAVSVAGWIGLAYRWWGTQLSRHALGQFAAAIVDHSDRSVVLVQDSFGVRPLFYRVGADAIAFAADLADLVAHVRPTDPDVEYFADTLARAIPTTERTPYVGIRRLMNGSTIRWHAGRIEQIRPWTPSLVRDAEERTEPEYDDELRSRLSAAVDSHTTGAGKAWCELSGGLDSTAVLAVGVRNGHALDAFTFVAPDGDDDGDTRAAAAAAAHLNVRWHTLDAARTGAFSTVPHDFRAEPGTEVYAARQAAYETLLRDEAVDAVLTGVGGDVTFGSPDCLPYHLADPLRGVRPFLLWRSLRGWQREDPRRRSTSFWLAHYSVRTTAQHLLRRHLDSPDSIPRLPGWLAPGFVRRHQLLKRARKRDSPRHPLPGRQALWQEVYAQAASVGTGRAMFPGTEFRHPLLDRRLVEFMLAVPYEQRQSAGDDRRLQRRALRSVLPDHVVARRRKGTDQRTFDHGLRTSRPWLSMLTDAPRVVAAGFVEPETWLAEVRRAQFGVYESLPHFVMAACIECWLRRSEEGLPPPVPLRAR
jgi:asparagine synthase (glutamine-hydrolysing)